MAIRQSQIIGNGSDVEWWPFKRNSRFRPGLVKKKISPKTITLNLVAHAWSIKYRRKKLIAQFGWKSRDKCFNTN